jgi:adenine deaminase
MKPLGERLVSAREILRKLGASLPDPLWTFGFLSFTSILHLRITISGVYDVKHGEILYNAKAF